MDKLGGAGIVGVGMAVPDRILSNADLEKIVDTSDEWIFTRTGIRERRITGPDETSATLGAEAAARALADCGMKADEVELLICATATGDYIWPSTACLIQELIRAKRATAFDIGAACSGLVFGLAAASGFIRSGQVSNALVVGVDTLTKQLNWQDRSTCVLFGDGAAAAAMVPCAASEGILATSMGSDGSGAEQIILPAGGTRLPITPEVIEKRLNCIQMRGAEVFRFAVKIMGDACLDALARAGLTTDDVDLFIPHQANIRIINAAAERMNLPVDKVFINVDRFGNTSAASIGIALREALDQGRVHRGTVIVTVGFGAGLTWGANVMRWLCD